MSSQVNASEVKHLHDEITKLKERNSQLEQTVTLLVEENSKARDPVDYVSVEVQTLHDGVVEASTVGFSGQEIYIEDVLSDLCRLRSDVTEQIKSFEHALEGTVVLFATRCMQILARIQQSHDVVKSAVGSIEAGSAYDAPLAGVAASFDSSDSADKESFLQQTINELGDIMAVNVDQFHKLMRAGSMANEFFGDGVCNLTDEEFYECLEGFYTEVGWQEEEDNKCESEGGLERFEHRRNEDDAIQKVVRGEPDVVFTDGELEFGGWFLSDAAIKMC